MKTSKLQQILKHSLKNKPRSTVTKGLDLSEQVHQSKKSKKSDSERKKKVKEDEDFS